MRALTQLVPSARNDSMMDILLLTTHNIHKEYTEKTQTCIGIEIYIFVNIVFGIGIGKSNIIIFNRQYYDYNTTDGS